MIQFIKKTLGLGSKETTGVDLPSTPKGLPSELGSAGLNMQDGVEHKPEDHPIQIRNSKQAARYYRNMCLDPTINGTLQMYTGICQMAKWHAETAIDDGKPDWNEEEALEAHRFLESCIKDMQGSMQDLISQFIDMLVHGFQVSVPQFKFRHGVDQEDPKRRSKYSDGKIGWHYFKAIDPYSVDKWDTPKGEGYSNLKGIYQQTISGAKSYIPRDRALIFRTTAKNDSPTGESILVGAVQPWLERQRSSNLELVGMERNLAGIPILDVPAAYLSEDATPDQKKVVAYLKKAGAAFKKNGQTFMLRPSDRDDNGNRLIDIELLSPNGSGGGDGARSVVEAKERLMAEALTYSAAA